MCSWEPRSTSRPERSTTRDTMWCSSPVALREGITGAVYLFDSYQNLITAPTPVAFQLSTPGGPAQSRSASTVNGAAWIAMDSSPKEGAAKFVARAGDISATRVIGQVP